MTVTLRLLAIAALALSLPACATPKKSSCCSASGSSSAKCAPGDTQCKAPTAKKKAN